MTPPIPRRGQDALAPVKDMRDNLREVILVANDSGTEKILIV